MTASTPSLPLGEMLIARGLLTPKQRDDALRRQRRSGALMGDVLIGMGYIRHLPLYQTLAEQQRLPFVNLLTTPPDASLLRHELRHYYRRFGLMPWRRVKGVLHIAVTRLDQHVTRWLDRHYGADRYRLVMTSPLDIRRTQEMCFYDQDSLDARVGLALQQPAKSARQLLSRQQRIMLFWVAALYLTGIVLWPSIVPSLTLIGLLTLCAVTLCFKLYLFVLGLGNHHYVALPNPLTSDNKLPVYTILVPLYQEQKSLPGLLCALRTLDYPKEKLDIKLIVEADDPLTRNALESLKPESYFDIVSVPPSEPRTKPKACNYALRFARGEMVTIFDAEDRPTSSQLRHAASYFHASNGKTVCLQARLNYHNRRQNWLTRLFAIEYAAWFDVMLKGLHRMGAPVPLGGTSNHIPIRHLQTVGAWDAFNVTEDADLGIRLALAGGKTGLLDSITLEEAPSSLSVWLKQRTRWIKGYIQTYIVHMRHPRVLRRTLGWRGFIGFQLFVGAPALVFLLTPLMWLLAVLWLAGLTAPTNDQLTQWIYALSAANLIGAIAVHFIQAWIVLWTKPWDGMLGSLFLFPFYWLLHSAASFRAVWQLWRRPFYWDKTPHRLTGILPHMS